MQAGNSTSPAEVIRNEPLHTLPAPNAPAPPAPGSHAAQMLSEWTRKGSTWAWHMSHKRIFEECFDPVTSFVGLECWVYDDPTIEPVSKAFWMKQEEFEGWLKEPFPSEKGKLPSAGYKMVQINRSRNRPLFMGVPVTTQVYDAIITAFRLPPSELHYTAHVQGSCGTFTDDDGSFVFVYRKPINILASTVLRYDPSMNITLGYFCTDFLVGPGEDPLSGMRDMAPQFVQCSHPLLLPGLMIDYGIDIVMQYLQTCNMELMNIEKQTGFTAFEGGDPLRSDYQSLARKLGQQHTFYSQNDTALKSLLKALVVIQNGVKEMSETMPESSKLALKTPSCKLRQWLEYLSSCLEHARDFGNFQMRLEAQQAVVFNLIAQSDTRINIDLAKDSRELAAASKQDSSAMKIIAVLTTLFLPGTFIATLFAMPLFDWNKPSIRHVTNQHYWLYWAVTGPLTLATIGFVASWALWHSRQTRILRWRARHFGPENTSDDDSSLGSAERKSKLKAGIPRQSGTGLGGVLRRRTWEIIRRRGT